MRLSNYTLSPTRINNAKDKLYKLSDGGGLFVEVSPPDRRPGDTSTGLVEVGATSRSAAIPSSASRTHVSATSN